MKKYVLIAGLATLMAGQYSCKGKKDTTTTPETTTTTTSNTPATAPVVINEDDVLRKGVTDATKDFPGVNATVENGVITLTGTMEKDRFQTLKQSLDALRPKQVVNNVKFN